MQADARHRRVVWIAVTGGLLLQGGLLGYLAVRYSPTVDELGHLAGGLYTWEFGRFDIYRVNPPLVRTLATLPVWLSGPTYDWSEYQTGLAARPEWALGRDLLAANGPRGLWYFVWARWMLIPLMLLGGTVCFCWARELGGDVAGLSALALWVLSPNVLTWGALITPDGVATSLGVLAGYSFWRWLREPCGATAVLASGALGLALLSKSTWIILLGVWPLLWGAWRLLEWDRSCHRESSPPPTAIDPPPLTALTSSRGQPSALVLVLILLGGLYGLNVGYAYDATLQPLGEYRFISRALCGDRCDEHPRGDGGNRFAATGLGRLPVPLPRDYVTGIDLQRREFEVGKWSYLRGEWRNGGWWYYYLYAALIKEPLGAWCLGGLALLGLCRRGDVVRLRDSVAVLLPGLVLVALVSSQTGFNRYLRYALPAFPFAYVWVGCVVGNRLWGRSWSRWGTIGCLAWTAVSSLSVYPFSLTYFNELAGGPRHGHWHLIDANVEWGHLVYDVRRWLDAHPEARPVRLTIRNSVPPELVDLPVDRVPRREGLPGTDPPRPATFDEPSKLAGWHIISLDDLHSRTGSYDHLLHCEPVDHIGYGVVVFHLTQEEAAEILRQ